jgi:hypothetical protein
MPIPEDGAYLFEAFIEAGAVSDTSNGPVALLWSEVKSFSDLFGGLVYWEAKLLRDMSQEYIAGLYVGKDPLGIPPWQDAVIVAAHRMRKKA